MHLTEHKLSKKTCLKFVAALLQNLLAIVYCDILSQNFHTEKNTLFFKLFNTAFDANFLHNIHCQSIFQGFSGNI